MATPLLILFLACSTLFLAACGGMPTSPDALTDAVSKELRPGKDIQVVCHERVTDGACYIEAEYRPLLQELRPIQLEMLDTYKVIYTSDVSVWQADIIATANLVDRYGNSFTDVVYRTRMDEATARLVNWERVGQVNPNLTMQTVWRHPGLR